MGKRVGILGLALLWVVVWEAWTLAAGAPATQPASKPAPKPKQDPCVAVPQWDETSPSRKVYLGIHASFCKKAKAGGIDLVFLGDSITANWADHRYGHDVFEKYFAPMHGVEFGIGMDQTQNLLWRIENGELEGISPKVVVVMIGANNIQNASPDDQIAAAIEKIVGTVRQKSPPAKILLLAVFPHGHKPRSEQVHINRVNSLIAKLDDGKNVKFLDIGDKFCKADNSLDYSLIDGLHPTTKGYEVWAEAIKPTLEEMMK